jgi:hypothetical protein
MDLLNQQSVSQDLILLAFPCVVFGSVAATCQTSLTYR